MNLFWLYIFLLFYVSNFLFIQVNHSLNILNIDNDTRHNCAWWCYVSTMCRASMLIINNKQQTIVNWLLKCGCMFAYQESRMDTTLLKE